APLLRDMHADAVGLDEPMHDVGHARVSSGPDAIKSGGPGGRQALTAEAADPPARAREATGSCPMGSASRPPAHAPGPAPSARRPFEAPPPTRLGLSRGTPPCRNSGRISRSRDWSG